MNDTTTSCCETPNFYIVDKVIENEAWNRRHGAQRYFLLPVALLSFSTSIKHLL
jgi:hypothetical protein